MLLSEIQSHFLNGILGKKTPEGLAQGSRFQVYSRAYRIRLSESLEEDFPETLKNVSDPVQIVNDYIREYPSTFWTVGEFAKYFPAFIRKKFPGDSGLAFQSRREWMRWVAESVGEPELLPAGNPDGEIMIVINPSLQIVIEEEHSLLIYYAGGELQESHATLEDIKLIENSRVGTPVSQLGASDEELLSFVGRWSAARVIIGFKEVP